MTTRIPFTKMVGTGNDFIVVDARRKPLSAMARRWPPVSQALCDRHEGIGADGVLVLERSASADVKMRVFNPDGSEAEMCGNGARCVALYLSQVKSGKWKVARKKPVRIESKAGVLSAQVAGGRVAMRMTDPTGLRLDLSLDADRRPIRAGFVNTGVPHLVVPVADLEAVDVRGLGRALRSHREFAPQGTNVNFIQPDGARSGRLRIRTYERGVEDETLACGTGIVASAVVHALSRRSGNGQDHRYRLDLVPRSQDVLTVAFTAVPEGKRMRITDVVLEGPAVRVFDGAVTWPHPLSLRREAAASQTRGSPSAMRQGVGWPLRRV